VLRPRSLRGPWRWVVLLVVVVVVLVGVGTSFVSATTASSTTSTTRSTTSSTPSTSTTTVPERRQAGWIGVSASRRGIMVDTQDFNVGGAVFRAIRMRARTTLLRWHVGALDPNLWAKAPVDAAPRIDWANEGPAGVVAAFNGAFKQAAFAGGAVVDGVVLIPMVVGDMTIGIDRAGHWVMGVWGAQDFPPAGFHPISYRQNLSPMVLHGALTPSARSANWHIWGSPLNYNPLTARTGLGVDATGNLIYVATMHPVMPIQVGQALLAAGAVTGMELDINPYWPIAGAPAKPLHVAGAFNVQIPGSNHDASIYSTGWVRDFFVALAEPDSWTCDWHSAGVFVAVKGPQPQRLVLSPRGCRVARPTTTTTRPTTTTVPSTSTTAPTL
jgi:hypothetical protein